MNGYHLIKYDAMVNAIAECHRVDEVKEIREKARAIEVYAKQAMNVEAERKATEIRLRAERRAGELFAELQRGDAGRPAKIVDSVSAISPYQEALERTGINDRAARRWQELADVDPVAFEAALQDVVKPTTTGIIKANKQAPAKRMDDDALWLWGTLRDMEKMNLTQREPVELLDAMTEAMRADVRRIAPMVREWLEEI